MARVFVSHSSRDNAAARELFDWLRAQGFEHGFLDVDEDLGIPPGSAWERVLYEQLERCQAMLLLLTPHWFESRWCFAEFVQARAAGKAIFPVIIAPCGERYVASDLQQLDLLRDRDGGLRRLAAELTRVTLYAQGGFDWDPARSPYPGLLAFEAEDAAIYFGRDTELRNLAERLEARRVQGGARVVAVLGDSGSGKSSLVRAGTLPRLARDKAHWLVMPPLRPRSDPVRALAKTWATLRDEPAAWEVLADRLRRPEDDAALASLVDDTLVRAGRADACLLITVDQAEELFTLASAEARGAFSRVLGALTSGDAQTMVLATMRSEMFGQWQACEPALPRTEVFALGQMPQERLVDVVEGPARVAGIGVDPALAPAITADAAGRDALPLVAFVLRQLCATAVGTPAGRGGPLTLAAYRQLGDPALGLSPLEVAVRNRADAVLADLQLDATGLQTLRDVFVDQLVNLDGAGQFTRRSAHWDTLDGAAQRVLAPFVDARLLTSRQDGADRVVEVAHEALLRHWPALQKWLLEEADFLSGRSQLELARVEWARTAAERQPDALLQGLLLDRAEAWLLRRPRGLNEAQRRFIQNSLDQRSAQRMHARRLKVSLAALGVFVLGLALVLAQSWRSTQALQQDLRAQHWLRLSAASLDGWRADTALWQAAQAHGLRPDYGSRSALLQAGMALAPGFEGSRNWGDGAISALSWTTEEAPFLIGWASGAVWAVPGAPQGAATAASGVLAPAPPVDKNRPQTVLAVRGMGPDAWLAATADGRVLRGRRGAASVAAWQGAALAAAAWSPVGPLLAGIVEAGTQLLLVDCTSADACSHRAIELPAPPATALAWQADGNSVAVALQDGRLASMRIDGSVALPGAKAVPAHGRLRVVALASRSGDPRWLRADGAGQLSWIDASHGGVTPAAQATLPLPAGTLLTHLVWSPDGRRLASACAGTRLCLWRIDGTQLVLDTIWTAHQAPIAALAWSAGGSRLASADITGRVVNWRLGSEQPDLAWMLDDAKGRSLADVSADAQGHRLAAASADGAWFVWDLTTRRLAQARRDHVAGELRAARLHPTQPWLAVAGLQEGASLVRLDDRALRPHEIDIGSGRIETLAWSADGTQLALGLHDGRVLRAGATSWPTHVPLATQTSGPPHDEAVLVVAMPATAEPAQPVVLFSADALGKVRSSAAALAAGRVVADVSALVGRNTGLDALSFSPDGAFWLAAGNDGDVFVFDRATGKLAARLETGATMVTSAAFSPDGRYIAATDNQERLHVWSGKGGFQAQASVLLRAPIGHLPTESNMALGGLRRLQWLPGHRVALATASGSVLVLSVSDTDWAGRAAQLHAVPAR